MRLSRFEKYEPMACCSSILGIFNSNLEIIILFKPPRVPSPDEIKRSSSYRLPKSVYKNKKSILLFVSIAAID